MLITHVSYHPTLEYRGCIFCLIYYSFILFISSFVACSVWFTPFEKHTTNGTYGGALGAMHEGDIDYILSGLFFTLSRYPYISPVMTLAKFRYVAFMSILYFYQI